MQYIDNRLPKICHAHVGDVVFEKESSEPFLVCAWNDFGKLKPARPGMMQGLYDSEERLFLVSLSTGLAKPMPHLSSTVFEIIHDAKLVFPAKEKTDCCPVCRQPLK